MARRKKSLIRRFGRTMRWVLRILLVLLVVDLVYLAVMWPDWKRLATGAIPKTSFMQIYEGKREARGWPKADWQPVPLAQLPRHMVRAVIVSEDSRFYDHSGFDLIAIKEALDYNLDQGKMLVGASTISQQTVKNLYLSSSRDPVRKWHELVLTWGLEHNLRKSRILEIYLNTVEFGRGVYGVQAAARHYYGVNAEQLTLIQAAELAASLPSPVKNNPATRTESFQRRTQRVMRLLTREQTAVLPVPEVRPADEPAENADLPEREAELPAGSPAILPVQL